MGIFRRSDEGTPTLGASDDPAGTPAASPSKQGKRATEILLTVDSAIKINDDTVLVDGWSNAPVLLGQRARHVRAAASPAALALSEPMLDKERLDVAASLDEPQRTHLGFTGCVSELDLSGESVQLFFSLGDGVVVQRSVPWEMSSAIDSRKILLGTRPVVATNLRDQVSRHVLPVLESEIAAQIPPEREVAYLSAEFPRSAHVNIVIPIYRNYHYLRNQLLGLTTSGDMDFVITLVCDDPNLSGELETWLRAWNDVYALPIQLVVHESNAGFAEACNTGLAVIDSEYTVLANSDVLFSGTEWIDACIDQLQAGASLAAPVLIYPDGSIQHAGMVIEPGHGELNGFQLPQHVFAGLDPKVVGWKPRQVDLMSGALLVTRTDVLRSMGGMPTWLGRGDFEDVALCDLMRPHGPFVICPAERLTHIEAGSYDRFGQSDVLLTLGKSLLWASRSPASLTAVGQHG